MTNFCRDCKWCKPATDYPADKQLTFAKCTHPNSNAHTTDAEYLVSGTRTVEGHYCTTERERDYDILCGTEGRWFEPRSGVDDVLVQQETKPKKTPWWKKRTTTRGPW